MNKHTKYVLSYDPENRMTSDQAEPLGKAIVSEGRLFPLKQMDLQPSLGIKGCFKWGQLLLVYTHTIYQIFRSDKSIIEDGVYKIEYQAISGCIQIKSTGLFD